MATTVSLSLRDSDGPLTYEDVDLDALTPRARTLAEAIAQTALRATTGIIMESDQSIRDTNPNWRLWHTEEDASRPERRTWRGWSRYPADSRVTPAEYLEYEARKIPPGWHVWGYGDAPVPSMAAGTADRYMTRDQALAYMRARGRDISAMTWSSYTSRGQAPAPDRKVGRTPQWAPQTIDAFLDGTWKATQ